MDITDIEQVLKTRLKDTGLGYKIVIEGPIIEILLHTTDLKFRRGFRTTDAININNSVDWVITELKYDMTHG